MQPNSRKALRVNFQKPIPATIVAADGTWVRECNVIDISEIGAQLTVTASLQGLVLKEFFLKFGSVGLTYRRCELAWVNGDKLGVSFPGEGFKI